MKVILIAQEIYQELAPENASVNSICFWIRGNIGALNSLIYTSYTLSDNGAEISPELNHDEKDILKKMYTVQYCAEQIRRNLSAAAYDVVELSQDGDTIRKINKNELSKTFLQMKKMEMETLDKMVGGYKRNRATALQVVGNEASSATNQVTDEVR